MNHLGSERGAGLIVVLAFMVLTVPLLTGALALASTLSIDARTKNGILRSHYSTIGASQYAIYRLVHEVGYADGVPVGANEAYSISLNGEEITTSVLKLSVPLSDPVAPSSDNSRKLQVSKEVTPQSAIAHTLTPFTYTVTMLNRDDESENLLKLYDELPSGFSYIPGSTTGATTEDPSISGQVLTWNLVPEDIQLQPNESAVVSFTAQASLDQGTYCNEAWVEPGDKLTSSGKTAPVLVGFPPSTLCPGANVHVSKQVSPTTAPANTPATYNYTIVVQNLGTVMLNVSRVRDLLPLGFLYGAGSTSGDIAQEDPNTTNFQGRQRLDWNFVPRLQIYPGETRTLSFEAEATVEPGRYWNDVWTDLDELAESVYTWPTAMIETMGVFEASATNGESTALTKMWIGLDSYEVTQWVIAR